MVELEIQTTKDIRNGSMDELDKVRHLDDIDRINNKKWISLDSMILSYKESMDTLNDWIADMDDCTAKTELIGQIKLYEGLIDELKEAKKNKHS